MALTPKTKLWIGLGVFVLIVLGLLSLNSDTFSGNLSMIPRANPQLCIDLKKACDASDGSAIACDNYKKVMCDSLPAETASEGVEKSPASGEATQSESPTPRRARPRSAAPQPSDTAPSEPTQSGSADDLDSVLELFPEDESQGDMDTSELR